MDWSIPLRILHYFQDMQATPGFVLYADIDSCWKYQQQQNISLALWYSITSKVHFCTRINLHEKWKHKFLYDCTTLSISECTHLIIKINKPLKAFGSSQPYKGSIEWHFNTSIIILSKAFSKYFTYNCIIHETFGCVNLPSYDHPEAQVCALLNWSEFLTPEEEGGWESLIDDLWQRCPVIQSMT